MMKTLFQYSSCYISIRTRRHFWDQAVGGRTALLGGIAVGGVRDYSATFYNPGALSFLGKNSMNFNFNMYGIKDFGLMMAEDPVILRIHKSFFIPCLFSRWTSSFIR